MSILDKRRAPLLSVLTTVKFETAPSLSLSLAALLVPVLLFAATFLERGLALPGLGPSGVDATLFLPFDDGFAVSVTAATTWFVVEPLAFAGENDGMATVFESGWAAETVFENHAVVKSEDMSVLPLQPRQDVGRPFLGCFQHCLQRSSDPDAALAFPFCFQFPLAASCAAMLVVFCLRFSGIERVVCLQVPFVAGSWVIRTCCTCLER